MDMDFDPGDRDERIRYAATRYGRDHVAQIITFGTIKARNAVRDAARVLGYPYGVGDKIAKLMPPLVNLKAMREAGTWENFLKAHAAFGADEQPSLTAATEGRTLPLPAKWNLFPKLHIREGEVPEGIIHWSGWPKPWHKDAKLWRPDIWEAERSTWEHLRMGIWEKPVAVEVEPENGREVRALAARGWKVRIWKGIPVGADGVSKEQGPPPGGEQPEPIFPDVAVEGTGAQGLKAVLEHEGDRVAMVRFGMWAEADEWLAGCRMLPEYLVLKGAQDAAAVDRVRGWGYVGETRLVAGDWPAGGPLPRVLEYGQPERGRPLGAGEWLYLKRGRAVVFSEGLHCGARPCPAVSAGPERIAVVAVMTGAHRRWLGPWLKSVQRNFLRGHERRIVIFTDGACPLESGVVVVQVSNEGKMGRFELLREHASVFAGMDYLFLLDAALVVTGPVEREVLGAGLTAVLHAGFHDQPRERFSYERRELSAACVRAHEGTRYFTGAVQGGRTADYLAAAARMEEGVAADARAGITAIWKEESHWNKCLVEIPPAVVLSPSYGRPEYQATEFPPLVMLAPVD